MNKLRKLIFDKKQLKAFQKKGLPIYQNRWLFSSSNNLYFNYNSKPLFEYILENCPDIDAYYCINDNKKIAELNKEYPNYNFINTDTTEGAELALSCRVWFTSASLPLYCTGLYRYYIIINLWHGTPLKKIALMDKNLWWFSRLYFKNIFSKNYARISLSSSRLTEIYMDSFEVTSDKLSIWGQPRLDVLYKKNKDISQVLKEKAIVCPNYSKLILYAPTYRDNGDTRLFPFESLDLVAINKFLEENKILMLLRLHKDESLELDKYLSDRIIDFGQSVVEDIMDYLNQIDILITDYSSIYIDYLTLNRPIIFLPYDKEEYLKNRGFNFDYDSVTPGYKPKKQEEFLRAIGDAFKNDSFSDERMNVGNMFNEIKGESCPIIVNGVTELLNIES